MNLNVDGSRMEENGGENGQINSFEMMTGTQLNKIDKKIDKMDELIKWMIRLIRLISHPLNMVSYILLADGVSPTGHGQNYNKS